MHCLFDFAAGFLIDRISLFLGEYFVCIWTEVILIHALHVLPFRSNHRSHILVTVTEVEVCPAVENLQSSVLEEIEVAASAWLPLFYLLPQFIFKLEQAMFDRGGD
jgi:hypothetical protein